MKQFKTQKISYTGCNPDIAKALQNGEAILCEVWDSEKGSKTELLVIAYAARTVYPYHTNAERYRHAKPIEVKRRYKSMEEMVKALIEDGYKFVDTDMLCKDGSLYGLDYLKDYQHTFITIKTQLPNTCFTEE